MVTLNARTHFTAIQHCSMLATGDPVRIGYYSFDAGDLSTQLNDWSKLIDGGTAAATAGVCRMNNFDTGRYHTTSYSGDTVKPLILALQNADLDASWSAQAEYSHNADTDYEEFGLGYIEDGDTDAYAWIRTARYVFGGGNYQTRFGHGNSGAWGAYNTTEDTTTKLKVEATLSDGNFTGWNGYGYISSWFETTESTEASWTKAAGGQLIVTGSMDSAGDFQLDVDNVQLLTGFAGTAKFLCGDSGTGTDRYIDFGTTGPNYSSFLPSSTNLTLTWDVAESDDYNDFDGSTWDATGLSTAQLQARSDSEKRYLQLQANATASGASPSLESISIGSVSTSNLGAFITKQFSLPFSEGAWR